MIIAERWTIPSFALYGERIKNASENCQIKKRKMGKSNISLAFK
jgi:hypothetical protein